MIIIRLYGGLGNQMFQYAFGRAVAEKLKTTLKLDLNWFNEENRLSARNYELSCFNVQENFASDEEIEFCKMQKRNSMFGPMRKLLGKPKYYVGNYVEKELFVYEKEVFNQCINTYFDGHWQCYKYLEKIREILLQEFSPKKNLKGINNANSVSIHVRRGDYIHNSEVNKVHGLCSPDYYNRAINTIASKVINPHFFLFSDDIDWVKKNFQINYPATAIDCNDINSGYIDMMLMKDCKHNILANSSFSWWGAWLNKNPEKIVIAPDKWFNDDRNTNDLILEDWIRINA